MQSLLLNLLHIILQLSSVDVSLSLNLLHYTSHLKVCQANHGKLIMRSSVLFFSINLFAPCNFSFDYEFVTEQMMNIEFSFSPAQTLGQEVIKIASILHC